ncbi:hypothetical protein ACHAQJ_010765 [Trichoderma viride]
MLFLHQPGAIFQKKKYAKSYRQPDAFRCAGFLPSYGNTGEQSRKGDASTSARGVLHGYAALVVMNHHNLYAYQPFVFYGYGLFEGSATQQDLSTEIFVEPISENSILDNLVLRNDQIEMKIYRITMVFTFDSFDSIAKICCHFQIRESSIHVTFSSAESSDFDYWKAKPRGVTIHHRYA